MSFPFRKQQAEPIRTVNPVLFISKSTAELMLIEALGAFRAEQMPEVLANVLTSRFGAAQAERIGERIGTLGHMKGRR